MVIVGRTVLAVYGHVELVGAVDEVQTVDRETALRRSPLKAAWRRAVDVRVGAVAAHAVGVEDADAEHQVSHGLTALVTCIRISSGSPDWNTCARRPFAAEQLDADDLHFARVPNGLRRP